MLRVARVLVALFVLLALAPPAWAGQGSDPTETVPEPAVDAVATDVQSAPTEPSDGGEETASPSNTDGTSSKETSPQKGDRRDESAPTDGADQPETDRAQGAEGAAAARHGSKAPAARLASADYSTYENTPVSGDVCFDSCYIGQDGNVEHGTLSFNNSDGMFTYTPDNGFTGRDSFTYTIQPRPNENPSHGTVRIDVVAAPQDDSYSMEAGDTLTVDAAGGVLANDGGATTATLDGDGATPHGQVTLDQDGSFTYTPDPWFVGPDEFAYVAGGSGLSSEPVTVTIRIAADGPPTAVDDDFTMRSGSSLTIGESDLLGNDHNTAGVSRTTDPEHGSLTENGADDLVYTPASGFTGTDTFTYTVFGPPTLAAPAPSRTATVTVVVQPLPTANDDSYTLVGYAGTPGMLDVEAPGVLENDLDVGDGHVVLDDDATEGNLELRPDGSFTYAHSTFGGYNDSFTYHIEGDGTSNVATVTLTYVRPEATDDAYETDQGQQLTVPDTGVLANDDAYDGVALLISPEPDDPALHGTLDLGEQGGFTYDPDDDFTGTVTFYYAIVGDVQGPPRRLAADPFPDDEFPEVGTVTITVHPPVEQPQDPGTDTPDDATPIDLPDQSGSGGRTPAATVARALPDTGSPVGMLGLAAGLVLAIVGTTLVARTRARH